MSKGGYMTSVIHGLESNQAKNWEFIKKYTNPSQSVKLEKDNTVLVAAWTARDLSVRATDAAGLISGTVTHVAQKSEGDLRDIQERRRAFSSNTFPNIDAAKAAILGSREGAGSIATLEGYRNELEALKKELKTGLDGINTFKTAYSGHLTETSLKDETTENRLKGVKVNCEKELEMLDKEIKSLKEIEAFYSGRENVQKIRKESFQRALKDAADPNIDKQQAAKQTLSKYSVKNLQEKGTDRDWVLVINMYRQEGEEEAANTLQIAHAAKIEGFANNIAAMHAIPSEGKT